MPIYEFRCLKCHEIFEIIFSSSTDKNEMKCSRCGSREMERVLSATNYTMGRSGSSPQANISTNICPSGSCSTLEIPGRGD